MNRPAAYFHLFCAICLLLFRPILIIKGLYPELLTEPIAARAHLAAEILLAALLIKSALSIFSNHPSAVKYYMVSAGMLIYSAVNSAGYFLERADVGLAGTFFLVIMIEVLFLSRLSRFKIKEGIVRDFFLHRISKFKKPGSKKNVRRNRL